MSITHIRPEFQPRSWEHETDRLMTAITVVRRAAFKHYALEGRETGPCLVRAATGGGLLVRVGFAVAIFMLVHEIGDILSREGLSKPGEPPRDPRTRQDRRRGRHGPRVRVFCAFSVARREGRGTWRQRGIQLGVGCFDRALPHEAKCHPGEAHPAAATEPGTGA